VTASIFVGVLKTYLRNINFKVIGCSFEILLKDYWYINKPWDQCGNMEHNYGGAPNQSILILSKYFKIKYSGALLMLRGMYEILTYIGI
jgi:hypothetical protein